MGDLTFRVLFAGEALKATNDRRLKGMPGLYLDPIKHRWVRTYRPAAHMRGAHEMQAQDFEHHWGAASRDHLPDDGLDHQDAGAVHKHAVQNAVAIGASVPAPLRRQYRVAKRKAPASSSDRIGNRNWWRDYGFSENPGWDGEWKHLKGERADPGRYNQQGVERAAGHMLRLRQMRQSGDIPPGLIDVIALFAISSKRTTAAAHERTFPRVVEWLKRPKEQRHLEDLTEAMQPLGVQRGRTEDYERSRQLFDTLSEGMRRFPDHGPSLRDWMSSQTSMRGLANSKLSFMLQVSGYEDVACIDARLIQAMTGSSSGASNKIAKRLASDPHLYRAFEEALARGASHKAADPAEIRLGMAQWRLWDAEGGSDTDHAALWHGIAEVTGLQEFYETGKALSPAFGVTSAHLRTLAAGLAASYDIGAGPAVYDAVPVMSAAAQKLAGAME